jgi:hypothetical protein
MEKMKTIVSWSDPRGAAVPEALKEYLPMINNAFEQETRKWRISVP